ncbi:ATP-binding protein (plasmid) [Actinacidiphila glaucinigra]|uniref:ATP-binding protein n=1 Tax=Actinacidiphila glaucinigra TaxID=235986 RepID=UPI002DD8F564|nr:ATP-binding protein [Actinacidiphila glaucinigra]WSD65902.1 ATP-binding protein [Actinacidiphila glaucinigra]
MTLGELQGVLGLDPGTLSRYLNGRRLPEIEFLGRLYQAIEDKLGAPLVPEVRANVRALYFAACAAHDPNRHEVYVLRDELAAAQRRAQEAEEQVRTLEAQLSIELDRRGELENRLHSLQIVAVAESGNGAEVVRLRDQREELSRQYEDHLRALTDQMRRLRDLEDAYHSTGEQLHQAERRLEAGLEEAWREEEASGSRRRWRSRASDGPPDQLPLSPDAAREAWAAFALLSRRSQVHLQRLLAEIDGARHGHRDPDAALSAVAKLAIGARRNSENMLLLAGEAPGRVWSTPVPLSEVLRHAAAEVEQGARIDLADVPPVFVGGREVAGLIRLFAELLDNAARFSAPATRVTVSVEVLPDGGGTVAIHDAGIGMSEEDRETINARLSNPPKMPGSRRQGVHIVGLLAVQHQARVQLDPHPGGGTSAYVTLSPLLFTAGRRSLPAADMAP